MESSGQPELSAFLVARQCGQYVRTPRTEISTETNRKYREIREESLKIGRESRYYTCRGMLHLGLTATNFAWMSQEPTRACLRLISPKDPSLRPMSARCPGLDGAKRTRSAQRDEHR